MTAKTILWQHFPKSHPCPAHLRGIVGVFEEKVELVNSHSNVGQKSDDVLAHLRSGLQSLGFTVESDKSAEGKIKVPVLYGANGVIEKYFDADAYSKELKTVIEVEATSHAY